ACVDVPCIYNVPTKIFKCVFELVEGAAVKLLRSDEFIARPHQAMHHDDLGVVAGRNCQTRGAAFERSNTLLQHRVGRVADAGIDVAEGLQAEQRGGVVDVLEHEGGRLIDWRCARTGGRIGLGAGMDRERGKAWDAVGHGRSSSSRDRAVRGSSRWFIEAPPGVKASGGRVLARTRTGSSAGEFV